MCAALVVVNGVPRAVPSSEGSDSYDACLSAPRDARVRLGTALGDIDIEIYETRAPVTACNFLRYVLAGFFDGGQFFRTVRPDNQPGRAVKINVVQADIRGVKEHQFPPIPLERTNRTSIHHVDGTISMARGNANDASSTIFIAVGSQPELDFGGRRQPDGQGFAAFGRVTRGMAIVRRIWSAPASGERLTPPISIEHAYLLGDDRLNK
jgi:peptidyl-prolyl cis-trans isomerase A (cyclophilin A)